MTGICLPIDASAGAPSFPAAQHRVAQAALMLPVAGRPLGARSGVRAGNSPTITATASTWTVTPFTGVADPNTALTAGPYLVAFLANETGAMTAANATNPRIDRLDVQVPDEPAGASPRAAVIVYTAGVAAATPAAPAAPARSFPLAQITVPAAGSGNPSVSKATMRFTTAAGGILPAADSSQYPSTPYVGQYIDDASLGGLQRWNGTQWVPVAPASNMPVLGSASGAYNGTSAGNLTLAHGLGFTPSRLFVQNTHTTPATDPCLAIGVDSLTSTTFRVRLAIFVNQAGNNYYVALGGIATTGLTFSVDFMAFP